MTKAKLSKPLHVHVYRDRHGKVRIYYNKPGQSKVPLPGPLNSPAFFTAYAKAVAGVTLPKTTQSRTETNSMAALIALYLGSTDFQNLAASSRNVYRRQLDKFREEHGTKPLEGFGRKVVMHMMGKMQDRPEAANNLLKRLKVLMTFAVDMGMLPANPLSRMKLFKNDGDGFHSWSEDEVTTFETRHPIGTKARLAMTLMLCTGQRRSDVVRMGWQHVADGTITVKQQKTGAVLQIPVHPTLQAVLAQTPKTNMTFLLTEFGKPFTSNGFGNWMRKRCDEAKLPDCSSHGLRKACAVRLAEAGCTEAEIMAITGHKTSREVSRYTKAVDQSKLAKTAIGKMVVREIEDQSANPIPKVSNNES